jgi:hypothetical protein
MGALSVFFSCAVHPAFHGLHTAADIKRFLTKPMPSNTKKNIRSRVAEVERQRRARNRHFPMNMEEQKGLEALKQLLDDNTWKVPSPFAALMLSAPMILLKISLTAFLVGLGVYLGKLCLARLFLTYGSGSIGILVFYIASASFGLAIFYIAQGVKILDAAWFKRVRNVQDFLGSISLQPRDRIQEERERARQDQTVSSQELSTTGRTRTPSISNDRHDAAICGRPPLHQSVHSRDSGRVHYIVNNTAETQPSDLGGATNSSDSPDKDSEQIPQTSLPIDIQTSSSSTQPNPVQTPHDNEYHKALQTMIKAQEQSLQATRRLLELYTRQAAQSIL